jgi:ABC-type transport system involved in multi-copper enzyme maturation permease subunit
LTHENLQKDTGVRLGLGPVFAYEWLTTTRRWQLYAVRAGFLSVLLVGMIVAWRSGPLGNRLGPSPSIQILASYGRQLFLTTVSIELSLVLLAAPAATAGAVCLDKARGTLDHMLATDLSNAEIVLGKLGVRLIPVLGLIACVLPISALASLLGGIDPVALFGSFLMSIACAILGCSLAMALSVWGRKTHEVLMVTYLILIIWLGSPLLVMILAQALGASSPSSIPPAILEAIELTNPYYLVFEPYSSPGKVGMTAFLTFLGLCLFLSGVLVALAAWRIRAVALKQAGKVSAPARRWFAFGFQPPAWLPRLPGPSLDGNPVLWREWQRSRPSRFLRVTWFLYTALGVTWTVVALTSSTIIRNQTESISVMAMIQVAIGLLLLSVSAATSLAEERARGSLDILLSTPLSTFSILVGKWWGAFRLAPHVIFWPALLAGILVFEGGSWFGYVLVLGLILAYSMVIASLGLALATWISRLGRSVAICVSVCVGFSIGWMFLIMSLFNRDYLGIPLIMGSPVFGTVAVMSLIAPGPNGVVGPETRAATVGASLWIFIHTSAAAILFAATLATFNYCMGRISDGARPRNPQIEKNPQWGKKPDFDNLLDDDLVEIVPSPQS